MGFQPSPARTSERPSTARWLSVWQCVRGTSGASACAPSTAKSDDGYPGHPVHDDRGDYLGDQRGPASLVERTVGPTSPRLEFATRASIEDQTFVDLERALRVASAAHRGQQRAQGTAYIERPVAALRILVEEALGAAGEAAGGE